MFAFANLDLSVMKYYIDIQKDIEKKIESKKNSKKTQKKG
jgi:hypothetical protein